MSLSLIEETELNRDPEQLRLTPEERIKLEDKVETGLKYGALASTVVIGAALAGGAIAAGTAGAVATAGLELITQAAYGFIRKALITGAITAGTVAARIGVSREDVLNEVTRRAGRAGAAIASGKKLSEAFKEEIKSAVSDAKGAVPAVLTKLITERPSAPAKSEIEELLEELVPEPVSVPTIQELREYKVALNRFEDEKKREAILLQALQEGEVDAARALMKRERAENHELIMDIKHIKAIERKAISRGSKAVVRVSNDIGVD